MTPEQRLLAEQVERPPHQEVVNLTERADIFDVATASALRKLLIVDAD
jgi:hypothetical protein